MIDKYVSVVHRLRYGIIVLWLALGITGAFFISKFLNSTTQSFDPPSDSTSATSVATMATYFPGRSRTAVYNVFMRGNESLNIVGSPEVQRFGAEVIANVEDHFLNQSLLESATSYFTLIANGMDATAATLVNRDRTALVLPIVLRVGFADTEAEVYGDTIVQIVRHAAADSHLDRVGVVASVDSISIFVEGIVKKLESDMGLMDAIVIPLALLTMAITVRSLRLIVLPALAIGLTLSVSFGVMYCFTFVFDVNTTTPSLLMSLAIAMSIDYNLFIMSRLTEELRMQSVLVVDHDIIVKVLRTAGHTVVVSAVTLMVSLVALVFFPVGMLKSFGVGCCVAIGVALVLTLTLAPALLLAFPRFFGASAKGVACVSKWPLVGRYFSEDVPSDAADKRRTHESTLSLMSEQSADAPLMSSSDGQRGRHHRRTASRSAFYGIRRILKFPWNVLVVCVVMGVTLWVGSPILHLRITDAFITYLPRGSDVTASYVSFQRLFGIGYSYPYEVLIVLTPPSGGSETLLSEDAFEYVQGFAQYLCSNTSGITVPLDSNDFIGYFILGGSWMSYASVEACLLKSATCSPDILGQLQRSVATTFPGRAVTFTFFPAFDPMGVDGDPFYRSVIAAANSYKVASPYLLANHTSFHFLGIAPEAMDTIKIIYDLFPLIMGISAAAVLLIVAIAFRSLIIPIRCVLSIATTEVFVFGLSVWIYQEPGILDWLHWGATSSQTRGISWSIPIVVFSVILGVALDYDVFLMTRIQEYAREGCSTNDAILYGVCSTGKIITAAGLIMAIAFFGLMLSSSSAINLLGYYMVAAVLYDTFVMRVLLAPALLSIFGRLNWFPGRLWRKEQRKVIFE